MSKRIYFDRPLIVSRRRLEHVLGVVADHCESGVEADVLPRRVGSSFAGWLVRGIAVCRGVTRV